MTEEYKEKRPWWGLARWQGVGVMIVGVAMLFNPVTAPLAKEVFFVGVGWTTGGGASKIARKAFSGK
jgi:uncharacterized membrane protein HdeD (DUF308 family)